MIINLLPRLKEKTKQTPNKYKHRPKKQLSIPHTLNRSSNPSFLSHRCHSTLALISTSLKLLNEKSSQKLHPANSVKNMLLLWASRHHGAALLCAEVCDGSIKHVDLVEEVDS